MTATQYASIALSWRVIARGNIIFKPSETTPNNLIGRCWRNSLLLCIALNFPQLFSLACPNSLVYVLNIALPLCWHVYGPVWYRYMPATQNAMLWVGVLWHVSQTGLAS